MEEGIALLRNSIERYTRQLLSDSPIRRAL